jgi:mannitol/fructose-specific phosphotransferase system IIA component (Ntr-type)/galactitol-specific phosphotransferase system IIB component
MTGDNSENKFKQETIDIAHEMIALVSEYVHPYLKVDRELERSLLFHLDCMVRKLKIGLPFQNPVLNEVKKRYAYVFEVTRRACKILEDRIKKPVSEEEIGFLAMHFAAAVERMRINTPIRKRVLVVCGEGVATAWLLVSRLKAELPSVEILEVLSAHDLRKKDMISGNIDAIIATLPIEVNNTPLIVVNPFLQNDDVTAIKRVLGISTSVFQNGSNFTESANAESGMISMKDLLRKRTIAVNMQAKDWKAVVESAVGLLVNAGMVEPAFMQSIKNLISEHGPYMAIWPGIALLHGPPNGDVKQICLSLITLDPPVSFGHPENDPVDIVFTLGTVNTLNHLQVLSEINTIVNSPEILAALRQASDENQILDILNSSI